MNNPEEIYKAIGRNIRHLRKQRDWTQADLAERTGFVRSAIANLEAGNSFCNFDTLCSVANALDVHAGALLPLALLLPDYEHAARKRIEYLESVLAQIRGLAE